MRWRDRERRPLSSLPAAIALNENARRVLIGMAVVVALVLGAGGGYVMGKSDAPATAEQKEEHDAAYRQAYAAALQDSRERASERGEADGLSEGKAQGKAAGASHGREAGENDVSERHAAADAEAAEAEAAVEQAALEAVGADLPPGYEPYPSTEPAPSGRPGVDPGCYPVAGIPCD
jgi:flagellar biosynthesis/type III secretory pathway protein FliH